MTRREIKKARTREAIASASLELFLSRGFDATTADDIAEASGISRRTFFRYFPTKEAAFFANQRSRLEAFREMIAEPLPGEDGFQTARRCLMHVAALYMAERRVAVAQQVAVRASRSLIAHELQLDYEWEHAIAAALLRDGAGVGLPDADARWLAGAIMGMTRSVLRDWFAVDGRRDLVEMGEQAIEQLQRGFGLTGGGEG